MQRLKVLSRFGVFAVLLGPIWILVSIGLVADPRDLDVPWILMLTNVLLGAVVLSLGIAIKYVIENVEAVIRGIEDIKAKYVSENSLLHLDRIRCRGIEVVDEDGNTAISLGINKKKGIQSTEIYEHYVDIYDPQTQRVGIGVSVDEEGQRSVTVFEEMGEDLVITPQQPGLTALRLSSVPGVSDVEVSGNQLIVRYVGRVDMFDERRIRARMGTARDGGFVSVFDGDGEPEAEMRVDEHGGIVRVYDKDGEVRAVIGADGVWWDDIDSG